jgi:hypothetical protein
MSTYDAKAIERLLTAARQLRDVRELRDTILGRDRFLGTADAIDAIERRLQDTVARLAHTRGMTHGIRNV